MHALLTSIGSHPQLALAVIVLAAFLESLAFIGTVVPAALVMFTGGALIGAGLLDLRLTLAAAVLGAIAGDGLSYELGRRHAERIRNWRLFKRYIEAFERGERFVRRHGGKSVLLARFIAPLRAVVPVVAGIAHMKRLRFYIVNILSAALWAPAHILPGLMFGASLQLAEAVTGRLGLLLLLVAGLLWLSVQLMRAVIEYILPLLVRWRQHAVGWAGRHHGRLARGLMFFLDPHKPQSEMLLALAVVLLVSGWLFLGIVQDVVSHDRLVQVDVAVFHFLHGLRTSIGDRVMLVITDLGSAAILLPLTLLVTAWLAVRRCRQSLLYWIAATVFSQFLIALLKFALARPRPFDPYPENFLQQFSFPSGHATSSAVIYGFLAFLLAYRQQLPLRLGIYATAAAGIVLIGLSRLYLGAHWLSDVLGGFSLGLAWISLLAMLYTHYRVHEDLQPKKLALLAGVAVLLYAPWRIGTQLPAQLAQYAPQMPMTVLAIDRWLQGGWQRLPQQRIEAGGDMEEHFSLQWAGSAASITRNLATAGWQAAPEWSLRSSLLWLLPGTSLATLPVLPKFNRGSKSQLAFVQAGAGQASRLVLRLWRSDFALRSGPAQPPVPLWYGTLYHEDFRRLAGLMWLYRTADEIGVADTAGLADLPGTRQVKGPHGLLTLLMRQRPR